MNYNGYELDPKYVKDDGVSVKWKVTGNGESAVGKKDGKLWLLKRNKSVLYPNKKTLEKYYPDVAQRERAFDNKAKPFMALRKKQNNMMERMKSFTYENDHIVKEEENFKDEENHFVTAARFVTGGLGRDDLDYTSLSKNDFLELAKEMTNEVKKINSVGVIHSDLKIENFVFTKERGKYIPYLIDFDISFPVDVIPPQEELGGSPGYLAPEVITYQNLDEDVSPSTITTAVDVFCLAATIHAFWSGSVPQAKVDGKNIEAGDALLEGIPFEIDSKFDFVIGPTNKVKFSDLLRKMLSLKAEDRPSAALAYDIMCDKASLDGVSDVRVEPEPAHEERKEPEPVRKPEPEPVRKPTPEPVPVPKPTPAPSDVSLCEPWPNDQIEFLDKSVFLADHFVKVERAGEGKYKFTSSRGGINTFVGSQLIKLGYAKKAIKADDGSHGSLWPEHKIEGYHIDASQLAANGFNHVEPVMIGDQKGYLFKGPGKEKSMPLVVAKLMRLIVK